MSTHLRESNINQTPSETTQECIGMFLTDPITRLTMLYTWIYNFTKVSLL